MLIWLVFGVDVLVANQWLLLGTAWAGIIYYVIICLLLIHCTFVTEKWNWPIGEWHSVWRVFTWWCRMIEVVLNRLWYVHAVKEFSVKFILLFVFASNVSYFGCLEDIPEPLRELNDVFLQLPAIPVAKGSPWNCSRPGRGGGHCGGGGRKSIQFVGAILKQRKFIETIIISYHSLSHLVRSAVWNACNTSRPSVSSRFRMNRRHRFRALNVNELDLRISLAAWSWLALWLRTALDYQVTSDSCRRYSYFGDLLPHNQCHNLCNCLAMKTFGNLPAVSFRSSLNPYQYHPFAIHGLSTGFPFHLYSSTRLHY